MKSNFLRWNREGGKQGDSPTPPALALPFPQHNEHCFTCLNQFMFKENSFRREELGKGVNLIWGEGKTSGVYAVSFITFDARRW